MELGLVLHAAVPYTRQCPDSWVVCDPSRSGAFDLGNTLIHAVRMPVFFLMSGFFAALLIERIGTRAFVVHRLRRIGLPFLVACIVIVPITRCVWIYGQFARPLDPLPGRFGPSLVAHFQEQGIAIFETVWHLWFLEYLLILTAVFVLARLVPGLASLDRMLDRVAAGLVSRARVAWLVVPTALAMWPMMGWNVDGVSRLAPSPHMLLYYGVFFVAGSLLHRERARLEALRQGWRWQLAIAVALVLPAMMLLARASRGGLTFWLDLSGRSLSAVLTCLLLFGVVGLFVERFREDSAVQRYLADAAYFVYLMHFPLIALLGVAMAQTSWPAPLKFAAVLLIAIPLLLALYHYCVRFTAVGRVLHGPRHRLA